MSAVALPVEAEVIERVVETPSVVTLRLRLTDPDAHAAFRFAPGQFNMLYLHGVGEVPISIVSDPQDETLFDHTIRMVGRVTRAMGELGPGARLGMRGPFGRGWPLAEAEGRDVFVVTGGLGCAPVVSAINYIIRRRGRFGRLTVMQGVKHSDDLLWRDRYAAWAALPETQVLLAADEAGPDWPWAIGPVTRLFDRAELDPARTVVMMCGPEGMMIAVSRDLLGRGFPPEAIWLSMERNMKCAIGQCGHCQLGPDFVCKDGPVFPYPRVAPLLGIRGF